MACSVARVTSSVLAPYWLDRDSSTPGLPWMIASPNFGAAASTTLAKSFSLSGAPSCEGTMASPSAAAVSVWP